MTDRSCSSVGGVAIFFLRLLGSVHFILVCPAVLCFTYCYLITSGQLLEQRAVACSGVQKNSKVLSRGGGVRVRSAWEWIIGNDIWN